MLKLKAIPTRETLKIALSHAVQNITIYLDSSYSLGQIPSKEMLSPSRDHGVPQLVTIGF